MAFLWVLISVFEKGATLICSFFVCNWWPFRNEKWGRGGGGGYPTLLLLPTSSLGSVAKVRRSLVKRRTWLVLLLKPQVWFRRLRSPSPSGIPSPQTNLNFFTRSSLHSHNGEFWRSMVVGLPALSWPVVSASLLQAVHQRTRKIHRYMQEGGETKETKRKRKNRRSLSYEKMVRRFVEVLKVLKIIM